MAWQVTVCNCCVAVGPSSLRACDCEQGLVGESYCCRFGGSGKKLAHHRVRPDGCAYVGAALGPPACQPVTGRKLRRSARWGVRARQVHSRGELVSGPWGRDRSVPRKDRLPLLFFGQVCFFFGLCGLVYPACPLCLLLF